MNEKLCEALDQISDTHIKEAARPNRSRMVRFAAIAAVLAFVVALGALVPLLPAKMADVIMLSARVAAPKYPERVRHYRLEDGGDWFTYDAQFNQPEGYADSLTPFFRESIRRFLNEGNNACSPVNVYMALAMMAETSNGNTRQQILDLLGADSIESLRTQAGHVWNAHYQDDGVTNLLLANSIWLDSDYRFNKDTANILAENYYASSFSGDLGSSKMNTALQRWLTTQTDNILKDQAKNVELDADTACALASTIYYRVKWKGEFPKSENTKDTFHSPSGDITTTFMNQTIDEGTFYYNEHYGAIALELYDGGHMWIVLPDEGYTPRQLLEEGDCLTQILEGEGEYVLRKIILSLPKFDIATDMDLSDALQSMGITDAFTAGTADFSPLTKDASGLAVGQISHGTRVAIDEEGITAAAYTMAPLAGYMPPELGPIEFTVNRPFLFVVTSPDGLPLFAGTVEKP